MRISFKSKLSRSTKRPFVFLLVGVIIGIMQAIVFRSIQRRYRHKVRRPNKVVVHHTYSVADYDMMGDGG